MRSAIELYAAAIGWPRPRRQSRGRHRVPPARPRLERNAIIFCPSARKVSDFPLDAIANCEVAIGADGIVFKDRHGPGDRLAEPAEPAELANATVIAGRR
jgi:hypothetical protein